MPDNKTVYSHYADEYEALIAREDYKGNILRSLESIVPDLEIQLELPDMLIAKVLRSSIPHGRIIRLDASEAETTPGVAAVLTAADFDQPGGPSLMYGANIPDPVAAAGDSTDLNFTTTAGGFYVNEGYGELSIPIVNNVPFVANLEGTFTERGTPADKEYVFRTPPRHAAGLCLQ